VLKAKVTRRLTQSKTNASLALDETVRGKCWDEEVQQVDCCTDVVQRLRYGTAFCQ